MEAKWQLKWSGMAFKGSKSVSKKVVENRMKKCVGEKEVGAIGPEPRRGGWQATGHLGTAPVHLILVTNTNHPTRLETHKGSADINDI